MPILDNTQKTLLIVAGPTASGKTDFAVKLAEKFKTEIISADSRQIYKELNIGVAMPHETTLQRVKHHFIRSHSIHNPLNAYDYGQEALLCIRKLFENHQLVIMAGGSGLFMKSAYHGIDQFPDPSPELRNILTELKNNNFSQMLENLKTLDPEYYEEVDRNNPARVQRALEVCITSGKKYSEMRKNNFRIHDFKILKYSLSLPIKELETRIEQRLEQMKTRGLLEEARNLYPFRHLSSLRTIGYQELFDFFDGRINEQEAWEKIRSNTRKYAKKQITWFKKEQFEMIEPQKAVLLFGLK